MFTVREIHGSNAQDKFLGTDFSFSKEVFKDLVDVDNGYKF